MSKFIAFSLILSVAFLSCGEPEDEKEIRPFDLIGKWDFEELSGDGTVAGVPQSDVDENPDGYVEFFEDGTGYSDFDINLLGFDFSKDENIKWTRNGNIIDIEEEDGARELWELLDTDSTYIEAVWKISFGSLNQADITMKLRKS